MVENVVEIETAMMDQHREAANAAGSRAGLQVSNTSYPELLLFVQGPDFILPLR